MTLEASEIIAALSAELAAAKAKIAELEAAVPMNPAERSAELTVDVLLRLSPQKRDICRALVRAYPRPLSVPQLVDRIMVRDHAKPPQGIGIKVYISIIRSVIGPDAIRNIRGRGYVAGDELLEAYGKKPKRPGAYDAPA